MFIILSISGCQNTSPKKYIEAEKTVSAYNSALFETDISILSLDGFREFRDQIWKSAFPQINRTFGKNENPITQIEGIANEIIHTFTDESIKIKKANQGVSINKNYTLNVDTNVNEDSQIMEIVNDILSIYNSSSMQGFISRKNGRELLGGVENFIDEVIDNGYTKKGDFDNATGDNLNLKVKLYEKYYNPIPIECPLTPFNEFRNLISKTINGKYDNPDKKQYLRFNIF